MTTATRPLEGVRVLDLSRVVAGPLCASLLGDLGAEVIKVEGPTNPDETRGWFPPDVESVGVYFATVNRNKRAITVDLKTEEGREIIRTLVKRSDVVVENFTFGTLDRLGLGYKSLRSINPGVVLCSITGFGQTGPNREQPGYDMVAQAISGFVSMNGAPADEATKAPIALADMLTGLHATISIIAALRARDLSGEGQHLDLSLLDSMVFSLLNLGTSYLNTGEIPPRYGNQHQTLVPYQRFETGDQDIVIAVGNDAQFQRLCSELGLEALAADERFRTASARIRNRETLIPLIAAALSDRSATALLARLQELRVPSAPINTIAEVFDDPHVIARGMVRNVEHPTAGTLRLLAAPLGFNADVTAIRRPPPAFSEHTDEVLSELGYSSEEISELRTNAVIAG
ncbi:CoA transferase [Leucobacter viscericola]|uniref:CoA transferase n=1 Tax=Leucobacter viscericola TaxID=2714935 RepID=A0A6G7XII1_9MICO|nr:CaiB/BaiF CoA-transferase family protein [Leucobacter viscericola]QIK64424.1 CoA transferase [Leucobacter viscericola]